MIYSVLFSYLHRIFAFLGIIDRDVCHRPKTNQQRLQIVVLNLSIHSYTIYLFHILGFNYLYLLI